MTQKNNPLPPIKSYDYPSSFRWGAGSDIVVDSEELRKYINQEVQKALTMVEVPGKYTNRLQTFSEDELKIRNNTIDQVTTSINKVKEQYKVKGSL